MVALSNELNCNIVATAAAILGKKKKKLSQNGAEPEFSPSCQVPIPMAHLM